MERIERAIRERVGLDPQSVGPSTIRRTIRLRMKQNGVSDPKDYLALLGRSNSEWNELVETVIVAETWFFRDNEPFNTFVQIVIQEWLPANPSRALQLLSLPCSSGEEPYSLAMSLLDMGFPPQRLQIDAMDISARALAKAKKAVYGKHSFRGTNLGFRQKYFHQVNDGFALDSSVVHQVRFYESNLLADDFQAPRSPYDFVFCRNLLIYFDPANQLKALRKLADILTPQALLFVGAAEQQLVIDHGFESAHLPMTFACRKRRMSGERRIVTKRDTKHLKRAAPFHSAPMESLPQDTDTSLPVVTETSHPNLQKAKRLADEGRLAEAATICNAYLESQGPYADAYYLLGLIQDAKGDPTAADFYRKALYLNPEHYDTLLQLALWSENHGDPVLAQRLKTRAKRVTSSTK